LNLIVSLVSLRLSFLIFLWLKVEIRSARTPSVELGFVSDFDPNRHSSFDLPFQRQWLQRLALLSVPF
jgi:hypothetical protein